MTHSKPTWVRLLTEVGPKPGRFSGLFKHSGGTLIFLSRSGSTNCSNGSFDERGLCRWLGNGSLVLTSIAGRCRAGINRFWKTRNVSLKGCVSILRFYGLILASIRSAENGSEKRLIVLISSNHDCIVELKLPYRQSGKKDV